MKRNFFHIPSFVYKAEAGASGGAPETTKPPETPSASDVTRDNDNAETGLKNAIAPTPPAHPDEKPKPPKPTPEEQARINQTVPASGEPDMRNFNLHPRPVVPNRTPTSPVKLGKIDGRGQRVPPTGETPPVRSEPPETPNKPRTAPDETAARTQEEQDRINKTVPASGEVDKRDFRVRRATPVMTNAPQAIPRKVVKGLGDVENPTPTTHDAPPTPAEQGKKKETPRFGPQGRIHTSDHPPETQTTTPPQQPSQDPDTEYRTYHRPDGTQERVSRRFGGPWRTGNGKGIIGQDDKILPETPEPPRDNPALEAPEGTPPTSDKPNKQRPFTPGKAPEKPVQTPPAEPDQNFNKLDFSGTTNPETTQGNAPSENTTTPPAPTNNENKEPPKPTNPEKNQGNRTFEEESADFQTRMERGEYHINNQFTDAGREHLKRVDALRPAAPATPGTEEKDKIPEAQPSTGDATPTQPSSATEASKGTPPTENKPPLPVDTEQSNEAVITVNGSSIPLTRESPDAAWRDRDGVPYGDALVAGSMKKDNAEKTQETKTESVPAKPPVPETPTAQPAISPVATNNTPVPPENSPDTNTSTTPSAPNEPIRPSSSTQPNKRPRIRIGGFGAGSPEEKEYLAKEKNFSENINNGSYVQGSGSGQQEFTPQGRQVFRELIATEHDYLPGALFNESTAGQGLPTDPEDQEKALQDQEKLFFQNRDKHKNLKQVESERTIVTATRNPNAQARPLNGGEQTINYRTDRVEVASPDENPRTVKDWLDWKPRTHMVPKEIENSKTGKIEKVEVEEIIPDRPSIYVYSAEEDALGNPRFSGRVLHPSQLTGDIANDNLYTANIDINGDGQAEQVWIAPSAKRAKDRAHSLSRGDAAVGPSQPATLIPKKPEKKEEIKHPPLPTETFY